MRILIFSLMGGMTLANGVFGAAAPTPANATTRDYLLGQNGNGTLAATLRVRDEATVADPDWLQIEINNAGNLGMPIDWRFELSNVTITPMDSTAGAPMPPPNATASVGGSNGPQTLPIGKLKLPGSPAALALATLGLPKQGVWRVRAQAGLSLKPHTDYDVGETLLPSKTVPVEFLWRPTASPEIETQRQWLRQYLASADLKKDSALDSPDFQRALALSKTPTVVMAMEPDDLLNAVARSENRPRKRWQDF